MAPILKREQAAFIVLEGIDGSGKTTLSRMLCDYLETRNYAVRELREPSKSPWGERIRNIARSGKTVDPREELELFMKDRRWNVARNILPALKEKRLLGMDRYFYSTVCYQGARGLDGRKILTDNLLFAPEPDRVFIIDIPAEVAMKRILQHRGEGVECFEEEAFLRSVRECYRKLPGNHLVCIDGNQPVELVFRDILNHLRLL